MCTCLFNWPSAQNMDSHGCIPHLVQLDDGKVVVVRHVLAVEGVDKDP